MSKFHFTPESLNALPLPTGSHRIDYDIGPVRGLAIQTTGIGSKRFLLVYVAKASGRERRMVLGEYGKAPKLSISAARRLAAEKRALVSLGRDPWLEAKTARKEAEAAAARRSASFEGLMRAYVAHLKVAEKPSWRQVAGAIQRHVTPRKTLAAKAADQVTVDDVMPAFHDLTRAGKVREAEKLRAYLRAAYTAARKARTDASMFAFEGFQIRFNPLEDLAVSRPKEAVQKAAAAAKERKWALSEAQLAAYWHRISADPSPRGALLRFHLLTGAQRVEQLARLTVHDLDEDRKTITLRDTKGRRRVAYDHVVPLIPEAMKALGALRGDAGPFLFSLSEGKEAAVYHTIWESIQTIAKAMVEAKEIDRYFTPGTIRKTVETRLQALGISREVRAHLLSHGLSGVQSQHYETHDYDDEKRAALRKLRAILEPKAKGKRHPPPKKIGSVEVRR